MHHLLSIYLLINYQQEILSCKQNKKYDKTSYFLTSRLAVTGWNFSTNTNSDKVLTTLNRFIMLVACFLEICTARRNVKNLRESCLHCIRIWDLQIQSPGVPKSPPQHHWLIANFSYQTNQSYLYLVKLTSCTGKLRHFFLT